MGTNHSNSEQFIPEIKPTLERALQNYKGRGREPDEAYSAILIRFFVTCVLARSFQFTKIQREPFLAVYDWYLVHPKPSNTHQ